MSVYCREGHASDEPDYCSVCGVAIEASTLGRPASSALAPAPRASAGAQCPSCGEPREDPDSRFCEVCRYDFHTARPGPPPVARAAPPPPLPAQKTPPPSVVQPSVQKTPPPVSAPAARRWEAIVAIDPALDTDPDPATPCPGASQRVIAIDKPELLIGRLDETRDIRPEIALDDPGASRRHAKLVASGGAVALQDLASTNGTELNGEGVPPGSRKELRDGDRVTLGRWTSITLRGRA